MSQPPSPDRSLSGLQQPTFGERLRELRVQRGLSQRVLAAGVVSPSYVSLLEAGNRVPTLDVVVQLANNLGVAPNELLGHELLGHERPLAGITSARAETTDDLLQIMRASSTVAIHDIEAERSRAEEMFEEARHGGDIRLVVETGARIQSILRMANEPKRRLEVLNQLAAAVTAADLPQLLGLITINRASAARDAGELLDALAMLNEGANQLHAAALLGGTEEAQLHGVRISILADLDRAEEALPSVDRMLAVADELGSPPLLFRAHWTASLAYIRASRVSLALEHLNHAREVLTESMTLSDWMRFCRTSASVVLDADGDIAEAKTYIEHSRTALRALKLNGEAAELDVLEARYELAAGNAEEALRRCLEALESDKPPSGYELARLRRTLAEAARRTGDVQTAITQLRILADETEQRGALKTALEAWKHIDMLRTY